MKQNCIDSKVKLYLNKSALVRTSTFVQTTKEVPELVDVVASEVPEAVSDEVAAEDDSPSVEDDGSSYFPSSSPASWEAENKGASRNTKNRTLLNIMKSNFSL